jgi:predicted RNase H-like HicB family nuclease
MRRDLEYFLLFGFRSGMRQSDPCFMVNAKGWETKRSVLILFRGQFHAVGRLTMKLTAIIEREGNGYVSLCPELDIASQGGSVEEARDNLREALELFFEAASPEEVKQRLHGEVFVTQVEVAFG